MQICQCTGQYCSVISGGFSNFTLNGFCSDALNFLNILASISMPRLPSNSSFHLLPSPLSLCSQLSSPMSSQTSIREVASPSRSNQRTFLDDVILTFTSPMAWLMVVALIITWSAVAIVLFDLLDYKTLAGNGCLLFFLKIPNLIQHFILIILLFNCLLLYFIINCYHDVFVMFYNA